MLRLRTAPVAVDPVGGPPGCATPAGSGDDGRERILDLLRASGLRFRDGGRWCPARV